MKRDEFNFFDEVAAGAEFQLPINIRRSVELLMIVNDFWSHAVVANRCTPLELKVVAANFKAYADNMSLTQEEEIDR